jgi:magnesium-transporting ATPase (P-type)
MVNINFALFEIPTACEVLACVNSIIVDKTAALTQNKMDVIEGYICNQIYTKDTFGTLILQNLMI